MQDKIVVNLLIIQMLLLPFGDRFRFIGVLHIRHKISPVFHSDIKQK